jgi:4,5-DOPA dioxygenase extradiol
MTPAPVACFVSHGAPNVVLDDSPATRMLRALGQSWDAPRAFLAFSGHWTTTAPEVGLVDEPSTIHDFSGFSPELYSMRYPARGAPGIGHQAIELLRQAGLPANGDPTRGIDHGVWSALMLLRPAADVPVLQVSLQPRLGTRHHYDLGRALAPLARDGVLVLGSGGLVHNLGEIDWRGVEAPAAPWALEFAAWMRARAQDDDLDALLDYRRLAPHARRCHPTDEHLLPLFVAMGVAGHVGTGAWHDGGSNYGSLVMDAVSFPVVGTPGAN